MSSEATTLKREIGLISGISLIVGTMIGSGIFISPGEVLKRTGGSIYLSIFIWVICGLVAGIGAVCYIELGTMIPTSGAEYPYILSGLGDFPAFLTSWVSIVITKPAQISIICLTCAKYLISPLMYDLEDNYLKEIVEKLVTVLLLNLICYINCRSVRLATNIQNIFTWGKLIAMLAIIIGGIYQLSKGNWDMIIDFSPIKSSVSWFSIASAFYPGLWPYDGWNQLNFITEELKNPLRNMPLSIVIGIPLVIFLYVCVNLAYLSLLSPREIMESNAVALTWVEIMFSDLAPIYGTIAKTIMTLCVAVSTFSAANGTLFTSGRLSFAASKNGHLTKFLSFLHLNHLTPSSSLIFCNCISIILILCVDITKLVDIFSFATWIIYGGAFLSLLILRFREPNTTRPFKVFILLPILMLLIAIYLSIIPIIDSPTIEYSYVLVVVLVGLLIYIPFIKYKIVIPGYPILSLFFQKILLIVPTDS